MLVAPRGASIPIRDHDFERTMGPLSSQLVANVLPGFRQQPSPSEVLLDLVKVPAPSLFPRLLSQHLLNRLQSMPSGDGRKCAPPASLAAQHLQVRVTHLCIDAVEREQPHAVFIFGAPWLNVTARASI